MRKFDEILQDAKFRKLVKGELIQTGDYKHPSGKNLSIHNLFLTANTTEQKRKVHGFMYEYYRRIDGDEAEKSDETEDTPIDFATEALDFLHGKTGRQYELVENPKYVLQKGDYFNRGSDANWWETTDSYAEDKRTIESFTNVGYPRFMVALPKKTMRFPNSKPYPFGY